MRTECIDRSFKRARLGHAAVKWPDRGIEGSTLVITIYIDGELNYVLLDTGSPVSFLPRKYGELTERQFSTVTGAPFRVFQPETHWVGFESDKRRQVECEFFGTDIDRAILGVDFLSAFGVSIDFSSDEVKILSTSMSKARPAARISAPTCRCIGHNATVYTVKSGPKAVELHQCAMRSEQDIGPSYQEDWQTVKRGSRRSIQAGYNNDSPVYNRFSTLQDQGRDNGPGTNCIVRRQCLSCKVNPTSITTNYNATNFNSRRVAERVVMPSKTLPCCSGRDTHVYRNQGVSCAATCRAV